MKLFSKLLLFFIICFCNFNLIFAVNSEYRCVVPKFSQGCQFIEGGLECPNLPSCVQYIVNNFHVQTTDLISVLYQQATNFSSSHCGINLNIPTSLYISVLGSYPATINCKNTGRYMLFNTSFTPYNPWLNITINSLTIINTMITDQDNQGVQDGGAVLVAGFQQATLYINTVEMVGSRTPGKGGFISSEFPIVISDSSFTAGSASGVGGAVYSGTSVITHSSLYANCITNGSGGAIFSPSINFMTSKALGNSAQYDGGALSCTDCYMFFSIVSNNFAGNIGGAVFSMSGSIQFGSVVFQDNNAGTCGGALHLINATGSVTTSNFTTNKSSYGGALCLVDLPITGAIDFLDSLFSDNTADAGGAIHITGTKSPSVIYHGIFYNNSNPTLSCDEASQFLCNNNCTISSCDRCGVSPCLQDYENNYSACFDSTCNKIEEDLYYYEN